MRPSKLVLIAFSFALIFLISLNNAFAKDNVSKAKEFMQANMYPAAIALLEKEVYGIGGDLSKANPRNYEAQFLLGLCYVRESRLKEADERFASAIQLKADYGHKIGIGLKDIGMDSVRQGELKTALTIFNKAEHYEPAITRSTVRELLDLGNSLYSKGREDISDVAFAAAVSLNPDTEKEACDKQYAFGMNADEASVISAFPLKTYCSSYNRIAGEKLIGIATKMAMTAKDAEKERYKKAASRYLGESSVNNLLPEVKIHSPGEYIFELKAGEQTPYWIDSPDGTHTQFQFYSVRGSEYVRVYNDGRVVGQKENIDTKFGKFKIKAMKDSYVTMVVE